jgi:uncharacterized protein (DUF305 family)
MNEQTSTQPQRAMAGPRLGHPAAAGRRSLPALIVATLVLALMGPVPTSAQSPTPAASPSASQPASPPASVPAIPFDRAFIDMLVPHHEAAIGMAIAAMARAEHPELRMLAQELILDQEMGIAQLRTWRERWYRDGATPPLTQMLPLPGVPVAGMEPGETTVDMSEAVRAVWLAEEPFDRAFIDALVAHHQSAIAAAGLAVDQAEHGRLKRVARRIVRGQQRQIDQLSAWRTAWYPEG